MDGLRMQFFGNCSPTSMGLLRFGTNYFIRLEKRLTRHSFSDRGELAPQKSRFQTPFTQKQPLIFSLVSLRYRSFILEYANDEEERRNQSI